MPCSFNMREYERADLLSPLAEHYLNCENDQQRENRQRFDERQTKNQQRLDSRACSWIPRHRFGRARHGLTLAESAESRRDRHADHQQTGLHFTGADAAGRQPFPARTRAPPRSAEREPSTTTVSYALFLPLPIKFPPRRWFRSRAGALVAHTCTVHKKPVLMFLRRSAADVNRRQQRKHVGLHQGHKYVQQHENHGNHQKRHAQEDSRHLLAREHVAVKTDAQRKGPHEVADQFRSESSAEPTTPPDP